MHIKMIVTDLDGTLLRGDKTIPDYTLRIFSKLRERGIKIALATARSDRAASRFTAQIEPDALICYGGALVKVGDNIICRFAIPQDISDSLIAECANAHEISAIYAINETVALSNDKEPALADVSHYSFDDFSRLPGQSFLKISVCSQYPRYIEALAEQYPMCDMMRYSGEDLVRFAHRDAVKWKAVYVLANRLCINIAEVAAFGDDYNDIDMLRGCGIGVAMENAIDEVKAVADYICDSNEADGVAKWLEAHVLRDASYCN